MVLQWALTCAEDRQVCVMASWCCRLESCTLSLNFVSVARTLCCFLLFTKKVPQPTLVPNPVHSYLWDFGVPRGPPRLLSLAPSVAPGHRAFAMMWLVATAAQARRRLPEEAHGRTVKFPVGTRGETLYKRPPFERHRNLQDVASDYTFCGLNTEDYSVCAGQVHVQPGETESEAKIMWTGPMSQNKVHVRCGGEACSAA